ncbi:hypothetical protein TA3x_001274 [Tundrisphaera sp. TA3]|uniref:hypothetical protein n=1 Tax=Tundrisphaera sp. TA3 TaxID=3435775 RepID=UPI003EBABFF3
MRRFPQLLALALLAPMLGCRPAGDDPLVIASPWPQPERDRADAAYRSGQEPSRPVAWVALEPGDRLADALARRGGVDLIVGGSREELARLAEAGRVELATLPDAPTAEASDPGPSPAGLADPRDDPAAFAEIVAFLVRGEWPVQYAGLVRRAAVGRIQQGLSASPSVRPGFAVVKSTRHRDEAMAFLATLAGPQDRAAISPLDARADGLVADLIGATMVDAHDEMRSAWTALERYGHPAAAEAPFFEAPPWPPASVTRLRSDPADAPLLETLAEQVAPGPEERAWLLESWGGKTRPIDGALLHDLVGAAGGRLAREPRFRSWLRAEWTAWARQRYRRVARVARGWVPS